MMELTRRMTLAKNCFTRIAGAYMDEEGYVDGTFNTHFYNLSSPEKKKNLELAKKVPFANTNVNLVSHHFGDSQKKPGTMWQLLRGLLDCELKNDELMETFYEVVGERFSFEEPYAIYVYHGCYDVPVRGTDKSLMDESEEIYNFMICTISPMLKDYEPDDPMCGFLFPAFTERHSDIHNVFVFDKNARAPHSELVTEILGCE